METRIELQILPQPDDITCGPTCLQAVYQYYNDSLPLKQVISEVESLQDGGTLAVLLGCHALTRGYEARIYTYNLGGFDPTWFQPEIRLDEKLAAQEAFRGKSKLGMATSAYRRFLKLGGQIRFSDLTPELIGGYLEQGVPILTGLSATYLYSCARERNGEYDDIRGDPTGHFVVLCGYDSATHQALIADPLLPNPLTAIQVYPVEIHRLISSILLGIVTYDANLLIITPGTRDPRDLP